ncbi:MAG: ATP-binding protein [Promethearchaeota archaeon]
MEKEYPSLVQMYKTVVEKISLPVLIFKLEHGGDNNGLIIYFNPAFKEFSKEYILFPKQDIKIGDSFEMFKISPGTKMRRVSTVLNGFNQVFQEKIGSSHPITLSLIKRPIDGKEIDVTSLESIDNQTPHQLTMIKLADDVLGIIYENLLDNSGNGFTVNMTNLINLTTSSQGAFMLKKDVITYANVRFIEMLGLTKPSDIVDKKIKYFVVDDDCTEFENRLKEIKKSETIETTIRFTKKDGTLIWLRLNAGVFNLGKDFIKSIVCNAVDITEQKRTELALFQTHRMASIGELSSGVAHEINNPLFGIMNYAGLVKDAIDEGETITKDSDEYEFIAGIIEESERISNIVNNLSEFSRNSDDRDYETTDLEDIIDKVEGVLKHQLKRAHVIIEKEIKKNVPKNIPLQKQRIRTALFNMVLNSAQAVKQVKDRDHRIKISLDLEEKNGSSCVIIKVWDNGIGIEDDKLVKVFDPFYTSNRSKKTGLGLHTVYQIVKDHNGDIRVSTKFGQWTEFTIRLPVKVAQSKKK